MSDLYSKLREEKLRVAKGSDFANWDIEVWGGVLGAARLLLAIEDHADGKQNIRIRMRPYFSKLATVPALVLGGIAAAAFAANTLLVSFILFSVFLFVAYSTWHETCRAMHTIKCAFKKIITPN